MATNGISCVNRTDLMEIKVKDGETKPTTIIQLFQNATKKVGNKPALRAERPYGTWVTWTWKQYYDECCKAAKSMIHLGLERFGASNIIGFNSPEWVFANFGSILAGGFAVGVYTTNTPETCVYVADHSEASLIFVENEKQLEKYTSNLDKLPRVKAIVMWSAADPKEFDDKRYPVPVYSWNTFLELGSDVADSALEERMADQQPGHCCTLVYTSGTTGNPKGVMLSHDSMSYAALVSVKKLQVDFNWGSSQERSVTFLPLSHVAGQVLDLHSPLALAGHHGRVHTLSFARPDALKGSLRDTLQAVKPTGFFGVPRVYEKFHEAILMQGKSAKGLKKKISAWARAKGTQRFEAMQVGRSGAVPFLYGLADAVVYSKVRAALGLDEAKVLISGAAPLSPDVQAFFGSLGVVVTDGYGMSESSSVASFSTRLAFKRGSTGPALCGTEIKIDNPDDSGDGEICFRGRHVMMGYLKDPAKTDEAVDKEGWLHTGDLGRLDRDGFLFITGRLKDLIITAGGENVAPTPIEDAIKSKLPFVSQAVLIGDERKFLSVLLTLQSLPDPEVDGAFTTDLAPSARVVPGVKTVGQAQQSEEFLKLIEDGIQWYNSSDRCVSNAQKVQYFKILDSDLSPVGDTPEMTPTLKIKRSVVAKKRTPEIEAMYTEGYSNLKQK